MIGGAMLALGSAVLVALTPHSGLVWPVMGALLVGLGMGSCNTTYLVSVQAAAVLRERGAATASNMFMRIVGQSTGAALFGALLNAGLAHYAPDAPRIADQLMEPGLRQALGADQIGPLVAAMAQSLHNIYIAAAIVGLIVVYLGWRLPAKLSPRTSQ
jgi:MFS family permease